LTDAIKKLKHNRVDLRISPDEKELLEKAASIKGLSLSSYVVSNCLEAARRDIETYHECVLSDEDRDLFLYLIENPPEPNQALKSAMARFKDKYKGE
jgi:uncharacterized protein (DUF1778 family)